MANNNWAEIKNNFLKYEGKMKIRLLKALEREATISKDLNFAEEGRPKWHKKWIEDGNATLLKSGRLQRETTTKIDLNKSEIGIGNTLIYGAIHQRGGKILITTKMRKFFWFKYFTTKDVKWMRLALTSRTHITIKARQYMGIPEVDYGRVSATMSRAAKEVKL